MSLVLVAPILIPFVAAVIGLTVQRRGAQRGVGVLGTAGLLIAAIVLLIEVVQRGAQVIEIGNWPAPFGITFVADLLSAIMVLLAALIGVAIAIYSLATIDQQREVFGYYPLLLILLMGVCGAFLTGDLFNLYVWFEVLLIASFVLLALGGERAQIEGAIKYVTLNLLSSAFFLVAVGALYGEVGTLNMADLARRVPNAPNQGLITTLAMLFLIAFGIKAAVFPLFFWLPASYHTPPIAVSALFAGLLTKVGVYALLRVFTLLFVGDVGYTHTIILIVAGLTMLSGVLGALAQTEIRRILSFLIVSHVGYAIMGLGFYSQLGLAGAVFYIIEDMLVLTTLFMISGIINVVGGSSTLQHLGGLYQRHPALAVLFLIPAFSMAGIPPLSGFWAKLVLLRAGLAGAHYTIIAVALLVSVLTLLALIRMWSEAFWKPQPDRATDQIAAPVPRARMWLMVVPSVALAALTLAIGVLAGPVYNLSATAAAHLMDRSAYIEIVLGAQP